MSAERLQSFLRVSVRARSVVERAGPFECFFNADDPLPNFNYAIPSAPVSTVEARDALPELEAAFERRERLPRFEFVGSYAPGLASALEASGYVSESETYAMACVPSDLTRLGVLPDDVTIGFVEDAVTDDVVAATNAVRAAAFGSPDRSGQPMETEKTRLRARTSPIAFVIERGRVVGAATLTSIHHGIAEVAGVAVLDDARRRGFGGALTALLAQTAFERGADRVVLVAADRTASRVYERVGFRASPDRVLEYRKTG